MEWASRRGRWPTRTPAYREPTLAVKLGRAELEEQILQMRANHAVCSGL